MIDQKNRSSFGIRVFQTHNITESTGFHLSQTFPKNSKPGASTAYFGNDNSAINRTSRTVNNTWFTSKFSTKLKRYF